MSALSIRLSVLLCALWFPYAAAGTTDYHYRVVASFPHATDVFTQGLVYHNDLLYESAGQYGESRLLIRTLDNPKPLKQHTLTRELFAEGITILGEKIYQLTWKSQRGFIYRQDTLEPIGEFRIRGEGCPKTDNGTHLIVSNGSSRLHFLDPHSFKTLKTLNVRFNGRPLERLNELEWIDGLIYANVWGSNWIVMIDPDSGEVRGKVRLDQLLPVALRTPRTDVLNGIAYDRKNKRLLVTGKYWPHIYHIELIAPDSTD